MKRILMHATAFALGVAVGLVFVALVQGRKEISEEAAMWLLHRLPDGDST